MLRRIAQREHIRGIEISGQANFSVLAAFADGYANVIRARGINQLRIDRAGEIALGKTAAIEHLPEKFNSGFVRKNFMVERAAIGTDNGGDVFRTLEPAFDFKTRDAGFGKRVELFDGAEVAGG